MNFRIEKMPINDGDKYLKYECPECHNMFFSCTGYGSFCSKLCSDKWTKKHTSSDQKRKDATYVAKNTGKVLGVVAYYTLSVV